MPWVTFRGPDRELRVGELDLDDDTIHELRTASMLELLSSGGARPTGERFDRADCRLLAPIPEPPSVRDFYAYEGHGGARAVRALPPPTPGPPTPRAFSAAGGPVAAGGARRGEPIPGYWYEA